MPVGHHVRVLRAEHNGEFRRQQSPVSPEPLAAAINCTIWVSYGLLKPKKDYPLAAANFPGIIFGLLTAITAL